MSAMNNKFHFMSFSAAAFTFSGFPIKSFEAKTKPDIFGTLSLVAKKEPRETKLAQKNWIKKPHMTTKVGIE